MRIHYYDVADKYLQAIIDWFKHEFGFEIDKSQAVVFVLHKTKQSQMRSISESPLIRDVFGGRVGVNIPKYLVNRLDSICKNSPVLSRDGRVFMLSVLIKLRVMSSPEIKRYLREQ